MKSISAFAIVSIIAILLAIGLIYFVAKPPKTITTTTTSVITETLKEIAYIPTTYVITATYETTQVITSISPTTITKTITQIITFTYVPEEKLDVRASFFDSFSDTGRGRITILSLALHIRNLNYSFIYIDPKRNVTIEGKGLLINSPNDALWFYNERWIKEPFIFSGNPYQSDYPAEYWGTFDPEYYNPKEIKNGTVYRVSFDYKVIYINGTWSDWKTFTFNVTYTGRDLG